MGPAPILIRLPVSGIEVMVRATDETVLADWRVGETGTWKSLPVEVVRLAG